VALSPHSILSGVASLAMVWAMGVRRAVAFASLVIAAAPQPSHSHTQNRCCYCWDCRGYTKNTSTRCSPWQHLRCYLLLWRKKLAPLPF
jgi:hypothetical protein